MSIYNLVKIREEFKERYTFPSGDAVFKLLNLKDEKARLMNANDGQLLVSIPVEHLEPFEPPRLPATGINATVQEPKVYDTPFHADYDQDMWAAMTGVGAYLVVKANRQSMHESGRAFKTKAEAEANLKRDRLVFQYCKMIAEANADSEHYLNFSNKKVTKYYHCIDERKLRIGYQTITISRERKLYCLDREILNGIGEQFTFDEMYLILFGVEPQ